ncbi:PHP domain-containing protein [Patescibacteria group bacterium]|nr:MAG: PHP domain-containing protein [Patescibacteria group bacterium]
MLKIDLHIHTIASRHAFNTILEYVNQAKKLKMKVIGISDHGPDNHTTLTDDIYFRCLDRIPKYIEGIRVLKGAEANIINVEGDTDISERARKKLDYVLANLHTCLSYKDQGRVKNTQAVLNTIKSGKVNIISHPQSFDIGDVDRTKIYEAACEYGVLLEINLSHLLPRGFKKETLDDYREIIDVARKHKHKVIVNSDAHSIWELADDQYLKKYKKEIGLTDNMIINNYPKELFKLLKIDE